jgi:hypothetical protein
MCTFQYFSITKEFIRNDFMILFKLYMAYMWYKFKRGKYILKEGSHCPYITNAFSRSYLFTLDYDACFYNLY